MSSRSLMPGCQARSSPASCRRTSSGSSVRNSTRPAKRTSAGSLATGREAKAASMRERCPLAGSRSSGFLRISHPGGRTDANCVGTRRRRGDAARLRRRPAPRRRNAGTRAAAAAQRRGDRRASQISGRRPARRPRPGHPGRRSRGEVHRRAVPGPGPRARRGRRLLLPAGVAGRPYAPPVVRVGHPRARRRAPLPRRLRGMGGAARRPRRRGWRRGVRRLRHRRSRVAVGRLQGHRPPRQDPADARERPRAPGLHGVPRAYAHLLRPLDLQARRGGAPGALGAILIHTAESATYGWEVVRGSWSVEQFKLEGAAGPSLAFAAWVTHDVAAAALAAAGLNLDSLVRAAARRTFRPVPTGLHAALDIATAVRHVSSANVAARLPGADPTLAREAVLFTAHWDHKGIGPAVNGDSIYNGAEDNASGVAAMLDAADALARVRTRPKRSVLFVATTAEESGLLGSEAYVRAPLVPLARTAAVINLDVTNVRGATRDIAALGSDRSTLGAVFEAAARAESLVVAHRPDTRGSFYRSDHFPFAKAGVPVLSLETGEDFVGRPAGWGREQAALYNRTRYHQPSDEYRPSFDYAGMLQQLRVALRVALAVADAPDLPRWLPSAEFQRPR